MPQFLENLNQLKSNKLIVYGAGGLGVDLINKLDKNKYEIKLVDDYLYGQKVEGYSVEKFEGLDINDNEELIVCSRFIDQFKNKIHIDYYIYYRDIDSSGAIDFNNSSNLKQYEKVRKNLRGKSLELYDALIQFRNLRNSNRKQDLHNILKRNGIGKQYLSFVPAVSDLQLIVDCGVFDGQTSYTFSNYFHNYEKIEGFDPLTKNFINNTFYFDKLADKKFNLVEYGLSDTKGKLEFFIDSSNPSSSSIISNRNTDKIVIPVTTLDEYYSDSKLRMSLLKMDIEGAEAKAISGGLKILNRDRPFLTISIYHSAKQMYEVPLILMNNLNNYQWKIGHYSYGYNETVIYGIPK